MLREDDASFPPSTAVKNPALAQERCNASGFGCRCFFFHHVTGVDDRGEFFELEFTPRSRIMGPYIK